MSVPRILSIAGSDSGGGAGIQADIRTITALGGHAMTAVTAVTAQNTLGVTDVLPVPPAIVLAQIAAVAADIGVDAVKIGMLGSAAVADAVAGALASSPDLVRASGGRAGVPVVFDPVMVATSGALLADAATVAAFERLMALATVVTPNLPELAALTGVRALDEAGEIVAAARTLSRRTGTVVLAKGGHAEGAVLVDRLVGADGVIRAWSDARIVTRHTHGTGCTLSSAIAAGLGAGLALETAVGRARAFVRTALLAAPGLGRGHGPMGQGLGDQGLQDQRLQDQGLAGRT